MVAYSTGNYGNYFRVLPRVFSCVSAEAFTILMHIKPSLSVILHRIRAFARPAIVAQVLIGRREGAPHSHNRPYFASRVPSRGRSFPCILKGEKIFHAGRCNVRGSLRHIYANNSASLSGDDVCVCTCGIKTTHASFGVCQRHSSRGNAMCRNSSSRNIARYRASGGTKVYLYPFEFGCACMTKMKGTVLQMFFNESG